MERPVVIKLGGSAITQKDKSYTFKSSRKLEQISNEISESLLPLVIISGGGSFGHPAVLEKGIATRTGAAYVRYKMQILRLKLAEYFLNQNIAVHTFSPYSIGIEKEGKTFKGPLRTKTLSVLQRKEVPFTSGDVVNCKEGDYVVLSGDDQTVYLANQLNAKRVIMLIDNKAEGVHPHYPIEEYPPIDRLTKREWEKVKQKVQQHLENKGSVPDVTGGIIGKIDLLFRVDKRTEVLIIGSRERGNIKKAINKGSKAIKERNLTGTYIPKNQRVSQNVKIYETNPF